MKKEKFNFSTKLHLLASKDELIPSLGRIYFKDGYAWVTDAHVLLKQSLEYHSIKYPELLDGKCIHWSTFQILQSKFDEVTVLYNNIKARDKFGNVCFFEFSEFDDKFYQDMVKVTSDLKVTPIESIYLDNQLIKKLSNQMKLCATGLKLTFHGKHKSVILTSKEYPNQLGLLMPKYVTD